MQNGKCVYISRNGKSYFLHKSLTKKGNTRYTLSTQDQNSISELPVGLEIYEPANSNPVIRKTFERMISKNEVKVIENVLKKVCKGMEFIINEKEDGIELYVDEKYNSKPSVLGLTYMMKGMSNSQKTFYEPSFKISKYGNEYHIERFCFMGSINDWMYISKSKDLIELCNKYFIHIKKESFFELI